MKASLAATLVVGSLSVAWYEFASVLKFIEERFNLQPLGTRDVTANDLMDSFNFNQTPQSPFILQQRQCP